MKKSDLAKVAKKTVKPTIEDGITDEDILELCPKEFQARFKKANSKAARADLLYEITNTELKQARLAYKKIDDFVSKLESWFLQELVGDETGVSGKIGRVESKPKEVATVENWDVVYEYIRKQKAWELLGKTISQKSIKERWEAGKEVPGIKKFTTRSLSLTKL